MRRFTAADLDTGHVLVTQGLAPALSLLHALVRECRDMGPTLESRVSGPLGRRGRGVLTYFHISEHSGVAGWPTGRSILAHRTVSGRCYPFYVCNTHTCDSIMGTVRAELCTRL